MQPNPETVWLIALLNIHKGYAMVITGNQQPGSWALLHSTSWKPILIHVAPIFDTIMHSVFTRRTKKMLNKLISFIVTKILAAVTNI